MTMWGALGLLPCIEYASHGEAPIHERRHQDTLTYMSTSHAELGGAPQINIPSSVTVQAQQGILLCVQLKTRMVRISMIARHPDRCQNTACCMAMDSLSLSLPRRPTPTLIVLS